PVGFVEQLSDTEAAGIRRIGEAVEIDAVETHADVRVNRAAGLPELRLELHHAIDDRRRIYQASRRNGAPKRSVAIGGARLNQHARRWIRRGGSLERGGAAGVDRQLNSGWRVLAVGDGSGDRSLPIDRQHNEAMRRESVSIDQVPD